MTSLHLAAFYGSLELATALVNDLWHDPVELARLLNVEEERLGTPLTAACVGGNAELIALLVKHGAQANHTYGDFDNPMLHFAVGHKQPSAVKALLQHGANIEATNSEGETALHASVRARGATMARLLIAQGTDVSSQIEHGLTPVMATMDPDELRTMKTLLDAGADIEARNNFGSTL